MIVGFIDTSSFGGGVVMEGGEEDTLACWCGFRVVAETHIGAS